MRADYHVHTAFSDDSDYVMEEVVKDAIARGLDGLCNNQSIHPQRTVFRLDEQIRQAIVALEHRTKLGEAGSLVETVRGIGYRIGGRSV